MSDHKPDANRMDDAEGQALLERLAETFPYQVAPLPTLVSAARQGKRRRTRRFVASTVVASAMVVGAGAVGLSAMGANTGAEADRSDTRIAAPAPTAGCALGASKSSTPSSVPQGPDYPTNANGLTYGGRGRDESGASLPDLVAVIGDCGVSGYVHASDLNDEAPWEPGAGDGEPGTVTVYESDGVTKVDTYTRGRGQSGTADDPTAVPGSGDASTRIDGSSVQGEWDAIIGATTNPNGSETFYRDLDLSVTFHGDRMRVWDGCQTWEVGFALAAGGFALTDAFVAVEPSAVNCGRAAPLPDIVENVRHVSRNGGRVYMHLANWQIALALTPTKQ